MTDARRPVTLWTYAGAVRRYLDGSLDGAGFCRAWSRLNSGDRALRGEEVDRLLMEFFVTVERFEPDPSVRADLSADEPGVYLGDAEFRPLAAAFLRRLEGLLGGVRMRYAVVRGAPGEAAVRDALAAILGAAPSRVRSARGPEPGRPEISYDLVPPTDGFGTQVAASFDPALAGAPADDHAFAAALARRLGVDALVLSDPAAPGVEPFFGIVHRPGGQAFRVPLQDLPSGQIAVVADEDRWQRWTPPRSSI